MRPNAVIKTDPVANFPLGYKTVSHILEIDTFIFQARHDRSMKILSKLRYVTVISVIMALIYPERVQPPKPAGLRQGELRGQ